MTEEEAKKKWCPMARTVLTERDDSGDPVGHVVANRFATLGLIPKNSKCVADACMMWRSLDGVTVHGYCGLAGKPLA